MSDVRGRHVRHPQPELTQPAPGGRRGLTIRSLLIGLGAVVFVSAFGPYNNMVLDNTSFFATHFPVGVTILMVIPILVVNPLLRSRRPGWVLTTPELITIWAMLLVASAFPTIGLLRNWFPWMVGPYYFLPGHPEWSRVLDMLPDWSFPTTNPHNDRIVANFVLGSAADEPARVPWLVWAQTGAVWSLYYGPLFLAILLVGVLLSRQWIVHEKLSYPIANLMLEMVQEPRKGGVLPPLFLNRALWIGAGVVIGIQLLNGLHRYYPGVPNIPLSFDFQDFLTEGFWQHFPENFKRGRIIFLVVGITFLVSTEVSLSVWFFTVLYCFIVAAFRYHGVDPSEAMRSQNYGMCLAMGAYILFLARSHLGRAFAAAFGRVQDPHRDYLSYRWIVWGLLGSLAIAVAWLCVAGMPLLVAMAQVAILLALYLVMARFVVETGMLYVWPGVYPPSFFPLLFLHQITAKSQALAISTSMPIFFLRTSLMPYVFNALRLGHEAKRREDTTAVAGRPAASGTGLPGSFVAVLAATMVVAIVAAAIVCLLSYYAHGAVRINHWVTFSIIPYECQNILSYADKRPFLPGQAPAHVAIGAGMIALLGFLRLRFARWPFVPIVLCLVPSTTWIWISVFVGWACKSATLRIGGVSAYDRVRPLFVGLVIGQAVMDGVWMTVGAIVRMAGYGA